MAKFFQAFRSNLTPSFVLNVLLLIALGVTIWMLRDLKQRFETLEQKVDSSSSPRNETSSNDGHISVSNPANGAMVLTNRINIEGEAEDNQIISLLINDQFEAVTLPRKGKFQFTEVPVKRGNNTLTVKAMTADGSLTALEKIDFEYNNPTVNFLSRNVNRGDRTEPKIAITFDGGYMANASAEILDILKESNVKCTLFLTGLFIQNHPDMVRRMVEEGHEIGNHTWSHPHLTTFVENGEHLTRETVTRQFLQKELNDTVDAFVACTGTKMAPFWRAPFGEHNLEIREWAAELGYRHIGWTVGDGWDNHMDTMDWVADTTSSAYYNSDEIVEKVLNFGNGSDFEANGAIVIMHLGTLRDKDLPHKKLPKMINGLNEKGYELVSVSELLQ
ncbi:polysaccharide deacetylase family protein [candidate division KSB1 bacterium]|nr:polysaccharide deacetylase family protein [candidate division KSB1 bacterium]NIR68660.1 polysaccharide deacetylase family protein [candidate division KSB1 bacterium]NIS27149.1 polysaccharide deacetylase family protein [candidate division KSB1 bacterium]NIT74035.1 polysaccharide deacetylase family protein [candidate division KSB1 bacterium]NIU27901.1 polysaccharide deacetylase family protein [candidate division KSB1 bacterium]